MSSFKQPMPAKWDGVTVTFKATKNGDKLGYIDTIPSRSSFMLVDASKEPLNGFGAKMPFEALSIADIMAKNKMTIRVQINKEIWDSLSVLDSDFDRFLIANRKNLFGPKEAEYLEKNPSAISLKRAKRLAPLDEKGDPVYDSFLTLRVNGRCGEVRDINVKEGSTGKYISDIEWLPRDSPLPSTAAQFSMVMGRGADGSPSISNIVPFGYPFGGTRSFATSIFPAEDMLKSRFIGPGDMSTKVLVHYACIRPAYWSCMNGGASIALVLEHIIFENIDSTSVMSARPTLADVVPYGFSKHVVTADECAAGGGAVAPTSKRRHITPINIGAPDVGPPGYADFQRAMQRSNTGGAVPRPVFGVPSAASIMAGGGSAADPGMVGSSSFRVMQRDVATLGNLFDDEEDNEGEA